MFFHSVKLQNYKSIGNYDLNEFIIEPRVTAVIGKNESGKSNVLDGLSHISFIKNMASAFTQDNINRNDTNASIQYDITLQPTEIEKKTLSIDSDTTITITKDSYVCIGGAVDYYNHDLRGKVDKLIESLGDNPFKLRDQEYQKYINSINSLKQTNSLDIKRMQDAIHFIEARIPNVKPENRENIDNSFGEVKIVWNTFVALLPTVFYRNTDKMLKFQYKYDDVKKELQSPTSYPNSLLSDFVRLIQISNDDFLSAVQGGVSGNKATIRKRIQKNIEKYINNPFSNFYCAESIYLSIDFDSNILYFSVQSGDGESLLLSERSNGLRWYINTFIDSKANDIPNANVLYLFDEPGTSLHVNAQKELIHLFEDLSDKGNQVIYTTHSPYMLNTDNGGIHRIRAVTKDTQGFTCIYKTAYDSRIAPESQKDTLTPIINAIGMSLGDTFGPAKDKINVICEGVSDYIYLHTLSNVLTFPDKVNFIPAFGVTNCVSICNILYGWNCPFVALFDFDKEGVEKGGEKMKNSELYKYGKHYLYLKKVDQAEIDSKEYSKNPYMIEDFIGRAFLKKYIKENNLPEDADEKCKTLLSKMLCSLLEGKSISIPEDCKKNFEVLFGQICESKKYDK